MANTTIAHGGKPWSDRAWSSGEALKGWEEHFGYAGTYRPGDQPTDPTKADAYGIGFGPGDLRRAMNRGYSATSIMNYLSGAGGQEAYQGIIPTEVKNQLRQSMSIEEGMYRGYSKFQDTIKGLQDKLTASEKTVKDITDAQTGIKSTQTKQGQDIAAAKALAQQVKITNPTSVTGSATQVQGASTTAALAGTIGSGLAGLGRDSYKLKNKGLNIAS